MSEIPEKQIKRLRSLLSEAETNLSAAKELLISILGDGDTIATPRETVISSPEGRVIEGIWKEGISCHDARGQRSGRVSGCTEKVL